MRLPRRHLIGATLGAPALLGATPAPAAAPMRGGQAPGWHRFRLGAFELTVVSDGWITLAPPHPTFGGNASAAEVAAVLRGASLPATALPSDCNCLVVNTGAQLVLIDTGSGHTRPFGPNIGRLPDSLAAAGIAPGEIDLVALTHAHPDHAWGVVRADGSPAFPNARYAVPAVEFDFWTDESKAGAPDPIGAFVRGTRAALWPLRERTSLFRPGAEVAPGIRATDSAGHSPGHVCFTIESEGQSLLVTGDIANHAVLSLARPDWHFAFDADPAAAVTARRRVFAQAATERTEILGYHFPWPGLGRVEALPGPAGGFRWVPSDWRWPG
jgi:glyoxylase-like metal-dependent hydrolase (beta-lactamase superfamily II)